MTDKKYTFAGSLDRDVKRKWLAALRSGEFEKGQHCLYDGDSYCCLGVLCKVIGAEERHTDGDERVEFGSNDNDKEGFNWGYLSQGLLDEVGITDDDQRVLSTMNDRQNKSFKTIARVIERNILTRQPTKLEKNVL